MSLWKQTQAVAVFLGELHGLTPNLLFTLMCINLMLGYIMIDEICDSREAQIKIT